MSEEENILIYEKESYTDNEKESDNVENNASLLSPVSWLQFDEIKLHSGKSKTKMKSKSEKLIIKELTYGINNESYSYFGNNSDVYIDVIVI
ncbi:hypothetical protein FG386_001686 [Cryptosporidium ryanae]|uniref:uncharacterized protein n=1 Tax=Cryptosporidium ryanae TaxID=515981 RepID=UPI00351A046D|nr:hypothetical protein FG386_001686 [Cryptosporidium ryanae]